MHELICYTDGAQSNGCAGIGVVFVMDDKIIHTYSKHFEGITNNQAELLAVTSALNFVNKPIKKLTIVTDSQYVLGCATKGWKRSKNKNYWRLYDKIYDACSAFCSDIQFQWVKGHNTDRFNELADKLAVKAKQND